MRLRRQAEQPARRQRLASDTTPRLSSFSYSSRKTDNQTDRLRRDMSTTQQDSKPKNLGMFLAQRIGLLIFLVVLAACAINVLRLSTTVDVKPFDQSASQAYLQSSKVYAAAASKELATSFWNRNKITVDTNSLSQSLRKQFPELTDVSVTMPLLTHHPLVYIESAQPALVLNGDSGSFIIGDSGEALSSVTSNASIPNGLPFLTDQSGLQVQVKKQVLPATSVKFIQIVAAELQAKQFKVSNFVLPPASSEVDAHLAGQAYYVKFNLQDTDPAGEAGAFLATVNYLKQHNVTPSQYVDVRLSGRAYYK